VDELVVIIVRLNVQIGTHKRPHEAHIDHIFVEDNGVEASCIGLHHLIWLMDVARIRVDIVDFHHLGEEISLDEQVKIGKKADVLQGSNACELDLTLNLL
jgi:hypothetical protein